MNRFRPLGIAAALCFLTFAGALQATTFTSSQSGPWNLSSTWGGGGVPSGTDSIVISTGHQVTLDAAHIIIDVQVQSGGILDLASLDLTVSGNVLNDGQVADVAPCCSGRVVMTGPSATVAGSGTFTVKLVSFPGAGVTVSSGTLTVDNVQADGTLTNNATLTVNKNITGSGSVIQGAAATLHVGGNVTVTTFTAAAVGNLVDFTNSGSTSNVRGTTYYDVSVNAVSSKKRFDAAATIVRNLDVESGTLTDNGFALTGGSGTLTIASGAELELETAGASAMPIFTTYAIDPDGTINYSADAPQTINAAIPYGGLKIEASTATVTKTPGGALTCNALELNQNGAALLTFATTGVTIAVATDLTGNGTLDMTSGGTITIGGSNNGHTGTMLAGGTAVMEFNGTGTQLVRGATYRTLKINNTGSGAYLQGGATFTGTLNLAAGVFYDDGFQLSGGGASPFVIMAAGTFLKLGSSVGSTTFPTGVVAGNMTIAPSSAVYYLAGVSQGISTAPQYGILHVTTATAATVTHTIAGGTLKAGILFVDHGAGTVTLNVGADAVLTSGDITGNGGISVGGGSLTIGGGFTSTGTFNAGTGTVTYTNVGPGLTTLRATSYNILTVNGGATFTSSGNINAATLNLTAGTVDMGVNTLAVSGAAAINGTLTGTLGAALNLTNPTGQLTGSGTVSIVIQVQANRTFNTTGLTAGKGVTVAAGITVTNVGSINVQSLTDALFTSSWINASGSTVAIATTGFLTGTFDATANGNTVAYIGALTQVVKATTYWHLLLKNAGAKNITIGTTINGDLTLANGDPTILTTALNIGGSVSVDATSSLTLGAFTHQVQGNWNTTGTVISALSTVQFTGSSTQSVTNSAGSALLNVDFSGSGPKTIGNPFIATGNVTVNAGASASAGTSALTVGGNWTVNGSFIAGTSTITFNGLAQSIGSSSLYHVTFSGGGIKTATGAIIFAGNVTISPAATFNGGSFVHSVGGNWSNSGIFNGGTSKIDFNGSANQSIDATTFYDLAINKSSGFGQLAGSVNVGRNLTIGSSTLQMQGFALAVSGSVNNGGLLDLGTGTLTLGGDMTSLSAVGSPSGSVIFNGTAAQSWNSATPTQVNNLTNSNISAGGVTLSTDVKAFGIVALGTSKLYVSVGSKLSVGPAGSVSASGGYVVGKLDLTVAAGVPMTYHVGTPAAEMPVVITAAMPGTIALNAASGAHPNNTAVPGGTNILQSYWTIDPSVITSITLQFNYLQADVNGAEGSYVAGRYNGGWTRPTATINTAANSIALTGVSFFAGDWTAGVPASLGAATKFAITGTTSIATGQPNDLTITATDALGSTDPTYTGTHTLVFNGASSSSGVLTGIPQVLDKVGTPVNFGSNANINFVSGVATAAGLNGTITLYKAEAALIVATEAAGPSTPSPLSVTVTPSTATNFTITPAVGAQSAGAGNNLIISAFDNWGNVDTNYNGTFNLVFSGANPSPGPVMSPSVTDKNGIAINFGGAVQLLFASGVSTANAGSNGMMQLTKAETANISATEGGRTTPNPAAVVVSPAALNGFSFALTGTQTVAVAFTGANTLIAKDLFGNVVTTFSANSDPVSIVPNGPLSGTVVGLGSSSSNVLDRAVDFTAGVANLTALGMKYHGTSGSGTFTATSASTRSGTSGVVNFAPGPASLMKITVNSGASPTASVPFPVTITATDTSGNPANVTANTTVTLALGVGSGTLAGPGSAVIAAGTSSATISGVTYDTAESGVILTANAISGDSLIPVNSPPFTVVPATADISVTGSVSAGPYSVGGVVTYTWTVTNSGPFTANSVILTNTVPAALSVVSVIPSSFVCTAGPTITCTIAGLAQAQTATVTVSAVINSSGSITNTANVSTTTSDPNATNDGAPLTISVSCVPPSVTIFAPGTVCANSTSNTATGSGGGGTYVWTIVNGAIVSGQGTPSIVFAAGTLTPVQLGLTVTSGGCSGNSSANITVSPNPPATITAGGPTTFCAGGSVNLSANSGVSYQWLKSGNPIATTQTISATITGSYTVDVTSAGGCISTSAPIIVTVNPAPVATIIAGGPTTFCTGGSVTLTTGGGVSFQWFKSGTPIATTSSISATASGSYTVTVTDANGCSATSAPTVVTATSAPTPTITAAPAVCPSSIGNAASTPVVAGATYAWTVSGGTLTSGQGTSAITFNAGPAGNVLLGLTVTAGSCSGAASLAVPINASSTAAIVAPSSVFAGSINSASVLAGPAGTNYSWTVNGGSIVGASNGNSITFSAGAAGTVDLSVSINSGGCSANGQSSIPIVTSADLFVSMLAPSSVASGSSLAYLIKVANDGPNDAASVVLTDVLPAGLSYVLAGGSGWSCGFNGGIVTCTAANLPPGAAPPITLTVTAPTAAQTLTNVVNVVSSTSDPHGGNNSSGATVTVQPPTACATTAPSLGSPAQSATVSGPVTFNWSGVANAVGYDVWASIDGTTPAILASTANTAATATIGGTSATWYVSARFASCPPVASASRTFKVTPTLPCDGHTAPVPTSPSGGSVTSPVTFTWQPAPQAIGYRLWISVNGAGAQDIGTTDGALSVKANVPAGTIAWYVEALFSGCPAVASSRLTFTAPEGDRCAGRAAAALISPAANSVVPGGGIDFSWLPATGASGYRLWAIVDGSAPKVLQTTSETSVHKTVTGGDIEWWVETLFDGCGSLDSPHRTLAVPHSANCSNPASTPLTPANGAELADPKVHFTWTNVPGAAEYEVWIALNDGTQTLLGTTKGTTFDQQIAAGDLQWFVRAHFDGCASVDSPRFAFGYDPAPGCSDARPLLSTPLDNTGSLLAPVTLSWKGVPNAQGYNVWIGSGATAHVIGSTTATHLDRQELAPGLIDWYVEATFAHCPPVESARGRFTVIAPPRDCVAPAEPEIVAPGSVSSGVQYDIAWTRIAGAASYIVQSSHNADFSEATSSPTANDRITDQQINAGSSPLTIFYRVRALSDCTAASAYSDPVAVTILPGTSTGPQLQGAVPADRAQTLRYTIPLASALAGLTFTAVPNQPWLSVTPTSGVVPAGGLDLTVFADTTGLPLGTSLGGVTIVTAGTSANGHLAVNGGTSGTTTVSVSLVQPVLPTPKSSPPPDALIIPAVAHADGAGSKFESDVRVTNTSPQVLRYQITFTPSGDEGNKNGKQTTIEIEPGRTLALDDILGTWFSSSFTSSVIGSLEIRPLTATTATTSSSAVTGVPNAVTFASSRTFNFTPNGTFGQFIPAIPFANFIGRSTDPSKPSVLSLQQIAQSSAFRTNLGFVEGSGQPATLLVTVFGDNGLKATEFNVSLAGGQHLQLNSFLASKNIQINDGRVEVRVTSALGRVTAYASVLDAKTSDPLLVTPVTLGNGGSTKYVVPGVADLANGAANWRTDIRVFNASASAADATLTFYSQAGGEPHTAQLTLAPNEVKQLDGVLQSTFGVSNDGGAVHITTAKGSNLIATARTFNQTAAGTYGQFISAVTPNDAVGASSRPLQLLQLEESDRFRTNVGLAEVSGKPARVQVTVVPADSRVSASVELDLAANQFRQLNQILKSFNLDSAYNARVTVKVISGEGKVTAYASVIDALTNDPTYVPAQ
jgi:uncharacterized repeat protein (TIGR01451 family)